MTLLVDLASPEEFFREQLHEVLNDQDRLIDIHVEHYLVSLFCKFIAPEKVIVENEAYHPTDIPLAFLFKEALEAEVEERARIFKTLGDTSLYVGGFFQNFFRRKAIDLDYFIALGSTAYSNASIIAKDRYRDSAQSELFADLSSSFADYIDVVGHVSDNFLGPSDADLLAIYERWQAAPSSRLFKKLQENGILPTQAPKKQH